MRTCASCVWLRRSRVRTYVRLRASQILSPPPPFPAFGWPLSRTRKPRERNETSWSRRRLSRSARLGLDSSGSNLGTPEGIQTPKKLLQTRKARRVRVRPIFPEATPSFILQAQAPQYFLR